MSSKYIFYLVVPVRKGMDNIKNSEQVVAKQEELLKEFLMTHKGVILKNFFEEGNPYKRNRSSWPNLKLAINYAKTNNCSIIFGSLKNIIHNKKIYR